MSFQVPNKAIPISVYSRKATFQVERTPQVTDGSGNTSGNLPIASQYTLSYKLNSDTVWTDYVLSSDAEVVTVDTLEPVTLYDVRWTLTGKIDNTGTPVVPSTTSVSDVFTFKTSRNERFLIRPPIPSPLSGPDFIAALQTELDEHINYINTLDDETSIERFVKQGVGKIIDAGGSSCDLKILGGGTGLYITNGYFQCGGGLSTNDERWYPGARFWQINDPSGSFSLNTPNTIPDLSTTGDVYGYMGAYLEDDGTQKVSVIWSNNVLSPRPDGRWLIGKVSISGTRAYSAVDTSMADFVPSLAYLITLKSTSTGGGTGGGTTTSGTAVKILLDYSSLPINMNYVTATTPPWNDIISDKTFTISADNQLIGISIFSDWANNYNYKAVIDDNGNSKEYYTSSNGIIYLSNLSAGNHTVKIQVSSKTNLNFVNNHLQLQILQLGLVDATSTGTTSNVIKTARNIIYDPSSVNSSETIYDDLETFKKSITKFINDKLKALNPGQSASLDYLVANIARALIGQGEINPSSLLRVDGSFVLPGVYGQSGIQLEVDGKDYNSPSYEGEGNLEYDSESKMWVI